MVFIKWGGLYLLTVFTFLLLRRKYSIVGAGSGQEDRAKQAVTASKTLPPDLYGLRKDHKGVEPGKEEIGPKVRPVAGASEASNSRLGHLVADLVNKAADLLGSKNIGRESRSTEEMVAAIQKYRRWQNTRNTE